MVRGRYHHPMKLALLVGVGWLCAACASSRAVAAAGAPAAVTPTTTPRARAGAPRAPQPEAAGGPRRGDRSRSHTIDIDALPPAFAQLSARDRERWHACHIFFLRDRDPQAPFGLEAPESGMASRPPARQNLGFRVTPTEYVAVPDEAGRREFLVRNGCPDSLVDLADGTHLDMIQP